MRPKLFAAAIFAFGIIFATTTRRARALELPDPTEKRIAAEVETGTVTLDQVFEIWGPAWYDIVYKTRKGEIETGECDGRMQKAWDEVLETVIREEMFYQEAKREFDTMIRKRAAAIAESQSGGHNRYDTSPSQAKIEKELRRRFDKDVRGQLNDHVERLIAAAGGINQLKKVIQSRGISWSEWRERIERKAFAEQYLRTTLRPRVPRNPRPADIRDYYKNNPGQFVRPGEVVFKHIFFSFEKRGGENAARLAASNVYDAIMEKRFTFEEAAKKFSDDDKTKDKGGLEDGSEASDAREAWLYDIREALRNEKPGEIGPIMIGPSGCHIVMLVRKGKDVTIPFREAQKEIQKKLYNAKWDEELAKLYQELKKKVRVKKLAPKFPAEYSWKEISKRQRFERRIGTASTPVDNEGEKEEGKSAPAAGDNPDTPLPPTMPD